MWQNWAVVNGTGCFRVDACLRPDGSCDLSCDFFDLNNVSDDNS